MTAPSAPTLADFAAWLDAARQCALDGMHRTTGAAFALHSSDFGMVATAINVLHQFQMGATYAHGGAIHSGGKA